MILLRGLVDVVADVVERAGEPVHVVAVERRHERPVDQVDELVREPVALVLELLDVAHPLLGALRELVQEVDQPLRDLDGVRRSLVEQVEELALLGDEADACHGPGFLPAQAPHRFTVRPCRYRDERMGLDIPDFQAYRGTTPPRFASQAELECAKVLDYYGIPWLYEPRTFVLEEDEDGRVREAFAPDFYLPEQDLYVELTVMKQSLVTRKNRKLRKLRERYPEVRIKLFYKRDLERLAQHFRLDLAS